MKCTYIIALMTLITFGMNITVGQGLKKVELNGYISGMPSLLWQKTTFDNDSLSFGDTSVFYQQNLIHNRINFYWYPTSSITLSAQLRNQLIHGDFVEMTPYDRGFQTESYAMPLSLYLPFEKKYLLYSSLDRLWVKYAYKNLEVKAGRQRINWSQTFAWNPNDIFNTYDFFDFDYEERPGADALKIQYYTGMTSSVEAAVKVDSATNVTAALMYKFNTWDYDIQLLAGHLGNSITRDTTTQNVRDLVAGMGWSGRIMNISVRGELTYLHPLKNVSDTSGLFYFSAGADYGFPNEAYVVVEFFYSDIPDYVNRSDFFSFYEGSRSLKNMTPAHYNTFAQVMYPFNPILTGMISGMYFFDKEITGIYAGPSIDISLTNALDASLYLQLFAIKTDDPYTHQKIKSLLNFAFFRLKYSF